MGRPLERSSPGGLPLMSAVPAPPAQPGVLRSSSSRRTLSCDRMGEGGISRSAAVFGVGEMRTAAVNPRKRSRPAKGPRSRARIRRRPGPATGRVLARGSRSAMTCPERARLDESTSRAGARLREGVGLARCVEFAVRQGYSPGHMSGAPGLRTAVRFVLPAAAGAAPARAAGPAHGAGSACAAGSACVDCEPAEGVSA